MKGTDLISTWQIYTISQGVSSQENTQNTNIIVELNTFSSALFIAPIFRKDDKTMTNTKKLAAMLNTMSEEERLNEINESLTIGELADLYQYYGMVTECGNGEAVASFYDNSATKMTA